MESGTLNRKMRSLEAVWSSILDYKGKSDGGLRLSEDQPPALAELQPAPISVKQVFLYSQFSQETSLVLQRPYNNPFWRLQEPWKLLQVGHGTPAPAAQEKHTRSSERAALDGKLQSLPQAGQQTGYAQPSSTLAAVLTPDRNKLDNKRMCFTANHRPESLAVSELLPAHGRKVCSLTHPKLIPAETIRAFRMSIV